MWRDRGRVALCAAVLLGCRQDMHDQPRHRPLGASDFFADGLSARGPVPGTVPREPFDADLPRVTADVLRRGRERFDIFCAVCHGRTGAGDGMIVRRGFRRPPSLHEGRLRTAAPSYLFDVISRGFGAMPDYASQIPPGDRWAIVAYVGALQLSQHATLADVPADERARLRARRSRP